MVKRMTLGVVAAVLMAPVLHGASVPLAGTSQMPWEIFTEKALHAICEHLGLCLTVIP